MSVLGKKWVVLSSAVDTPALQKILETRAHRGLNALSELHDPFLFRDMERAVSRIQKAITEGQPILIFGDYDVDGISGTAILVQALRHLNAKVSYQLPDRVHDGYGLSEKFIDQFASDGIKLLITVDCGISCATQIEKAKKLGLDVIITDHHAIPEIFPKQAYAILHPKEKDSGYPFAELTGSAVAFKLAQALLNDEEISTGLIDLAALGVVADLGPLIGENRLIVKRGLASLAATKWPGLRQIIKSAGISPEKEIDTYDIGFKLAPRINAAGRIGHAHSALSLLLEEDEATILRLAGELEELNGARQDMTYVALSEAEKIFSEKELPYILIAENTNWHVGVLGLIAGRLVERFARPAIILQDLGDTLVASARSPEVFHITEALAEFSHHLITFGGHAQAAGFNIKKENYPEFKKAISEFAAEKLANTDLRPALEIDCDIMTEELSFGFLEELDNLSPFGVGNRRPVFMLKNVTPLFIDQVGPKGEHLRFTIPSTGNGLRAIGFHLGKFLPLLRTQKNIDLAFSFERNIWNGRAYLQLRALDFRPAG
ncbi:MAG: single-stranded-DNA-specific exonuclease RecJ [Candidatus Gracilibacteria bacterium]